MSDSTATLLAAFGSLLVGYFLGQRTEMRAAHRQALATHLHALASNLHRVVASVHIADKRAARGEDWADWHRKAEQAATDLKRVRHEIRYALWGTDLALRSLSRLPSWWSNFRDDRKRVIWLLTAADNLRHVLDIMVRRSYALGRPPTVLDRAQIAWYRSRLDKQWRDFAVRDEDDEEKPAG